jgi:hypothetical protein
LELDADLRTTDQGADYMNCLNFRRVDIKSLKLPGDIKARMKAPHVIELAASIEKFGGEPVEPPVVQDKTRVLIAGRDRIAALMLNKVPRVWVRIVEGEPEELKGLEIDENLRRRQDSRKELLAEAMKLEKATKEAEAKELGTSVPRPKAIREAVAKKAGIKPESVRKSVQRSKAKEAPPKPEKPPIDTFGLELSKGLSTAVSRIKDALMSMEQSSKNVQHVISGVAGILPGQVTARLLEAARTLGAEVRAVMPTHLCPTCRGDGDEKCKLCKGAHYARHEQMADVPREQLERVKPGNGLHLEA